MVGRSQSSQRAKALQSLIHEYIKVILVVYRELVYQREDCFIFAEVGLYIGVSERAYAVCTLFVCSFPQTHRA